MAFLQRKANETTLALLDEPIFAAQPAEKSSPTLTTTTKPVANVDPSFPILSNNVAEDLRNCWTEVQGAFVDEPRDAVKQADELVALAIKEITDSFSEARNNLERQWTRSGNVDTEDLRVTFKKYRSFFQKLMAV